MLVCPEAFITAMTVRVCIPFRSIGHTYLRVSRSQGIFLAASTDKTNHISSLLFFVRLILGVLFSPENDQIVLAKSVLSWNDSSNCLLQPDTEVG